MPIPIVRFIGWRSSIGVTLAALNLAALYVTARSWPSMVMNMKFHGTPYYYMSDESTVMGPGMLESWPTLVRPPSFARLCSIWYPTVAASGVSVLSLAVTRIIAKPAASYRFGLKTLIALVALSALVMGWVALCLRPPTRHPDLVLWLIRGAVPLAALLVSSLCIGKIVAHDASWDKGDVQPFDA